MQTFKTYAYSTLMRMAKNELIEHLRSDSKEHGE